MSNIPRPPLRPEELFDEALRLKERAEKAEAERDLYHQRLAATMMIAESNESEIWRLKANLRRAL